MGIYDRFVENECELIHKGSGKIGTPKIARDAQGAGRGPAAGAGHLVVKAGYPPEDTLGEADVAAAKWAWEKRQAD